MRWPVELHRVLRNEVAHRAAPERVSSVASMIGRFANAARSGDAANEGDAIDELLTAIDIMDDDPSYWTGGVATRLEGALLLGRQGRIAEAEAALDRPLTLILAQIKASPETAAERTVAEASLLSNAAAAVDIQAARQAVNRAICSWIMAGVALRANRADLADFLLSYHREQLPIAAARLYQAVINSKAAWNYARLTQRTDLKSFALERLEIALKAAGEQAAAALVAERRLEIGAQPHSHWIIDPETWSL